jgi:allantoicase
MTADPNLPEFARRLVNLASPQLGSKAVFASDEFFAPKERLLQHVPPVFLPDKFDDHGKSMDGWESRRRPDGGDEFCIIRLGVKGVVHGVDIDTSHFTGNYPPAASIDAWLSVVEPGPDGDWREILPPAPLGPSAHHFLPVPPSGPFNYLRLHIYPDGGVARLRVYGEPVASWEGAARDAVHELSALRNGGRIVAYNDAHYGTVWTLLSEGRGTHMGDGWETRRRREPGNDWIIVRLGAAGLVERILIDTCHFKGNYPDRASVQAGYVAAGTDEAVVTQSMFWPELMAPQKLSADAVHEYAGEAVARLGAVSHVKLNIFPDGGVSRLRIFGRLVSAAK